MQNDLNWPVVVLTLGTAIITAISTGLGSWLVYRFQLRIKMAELKEQSRLKARELLFHSYQKQIEDVNKQAETIGAVFGQLAQLSQNESEDERKGSLVALLFMMKTSVALMMDWAKQLETDLTEVNLITRRQNDLAYIKQTFSINLDQITLEEIGPLYLKFMAAIGLVYSINGEVLNKKSANLLNDYVAT